MADELTIECKLARDYTMEKVPDAMAYLLIKVVPNLSIDLVSPPLNIGLVIDVSWSMKGQKIKHAIEAAKLLVEKLGKDDFVSVTTFCYEAQAIVPGGKTLDRATMLAAIDKIRLLSGTRMYHGMEWGVREMRKAGFSGKVNRMILLTDGETEGEEHCRLIAEQERENNIVISTLGIGERYNEDLLSRIADISLGQFSHLKTPEQVGEIFQRELGTASAAAISNVTLGLKLAGGAKLERFDRVFPNSTRLQPKGESEGKALAFDAGNLGKNEVSIFGAQLRLPARPAGRVKIADLSVAYSIPSPRSKGSDTQVRGGDTRTRSRVEKRTVTVNYTDNKELCGMVDREVISYFNQVNAQKLLEKAIEETKTGDMTAATESLTQAREITERLGNLPLTENIDEAVDELERKGALSSDSVKTIKAGSRKTVRIDETKLK
jgi:Ca-activated chloride channel family protein